MMRAVDYQFSKGRVQHVSLNGERLTTHQYKANGLETDRQHGSLKSQYLYDEMGRLLEHTSRQQAQLKLRRRYEYSQAGNLTTIDDAQRGQTQYEYDPLDRLTTVRGVVDESFLHDPAGNLLLDRKANVEGNQLRFQGDKHYTYDEFGNLARESRGRAGKLVTDYEYDVQHRLIKVTKPDGSVATYQYDAFEFGLSLNARTLNGNAPILGDVYNGRGAILKICQKPSRFNIYPLFCICRIIRLDDFLVWVEPTSSLSHRI